MRNRETWAFTAVVILSAVPCAHAQTQISVAAPIGIAPQLWVDVDPLESGVQVARVVEPGIFEVDVLAFNIPLMLPPSFPQDVRHAVIWIHYDQSVINLIDALPAPLLGGMPDAAVGICHPLPFPGTCPPPTGPFCSPAMPNAAKIIIDRPPPAAPGCLTFGPPPNFVVVRLVFCANGVSGQSGLDIGPGLPFPPFNATELHWYEEAPFDPPGLPCGTDYIPIVPSADFSYARARVVVDSTGTLSCLNVNGQGDASVDAAGIDLLNPDTSPSSLAFDKVTLRSAIQIANAMEGENKITFRIPGDPTVAVLSALPTLDDDATEIDGETQNAIILDGTSATALVGPPTSGLTSAAADCRFRFLTINNFASGAGIRITGATATNNLIVGCKIGTDALGTVAMPNFDGVVIEAGANNNIIGIPGTVSFNVISGNTQYGVHIKDEDTRLNVVRNNYIGTNPAGAALGNEWGVVINDQARENQIGTKKLYPGVECGLTASELMDRNVICANTHDGIALGGGAQFNSIQGNYIGVTPADNAVGNGEVGISIASSYFNNIDENVIGDNHTGIDISNSTETVMRCNHVGTDLTDMLARGNTHGGIRIGGSAPENSNGNLVGKTTVAGGGQIFRNGNVIRYNHAWGVEIYDRASNTELIGNDVRNNGTVGLLTGGVMLSASPAGGTLVFATRIGGSRDLLENNVIRNNIGPGLEVVGPGTQGTLILGNDIMNNFRGIKISNGPTGTKIGDRVDDSKRNIITGNPLSGVTILDPAAALGTEIVRNSIFDNDPSDWRGRAAATVLGIDLNDDGVTPNDPDDADGGPNHLQNFPVLANATICCGGSVTITGALNSVPMSNFHLEFFLNDDCDSTTDPAEGQTYLGSLALPAEGGKYTFTVNFPGPANVGQFVTATATGEELKETSEFSACRIVTAIPADLNGDGSVNGADLGILLGNWGQTGVGDLNGDGTVDGADYGILLAAWTG